MPFEEAFRSLRTSLQFARASDPPRSVAITSSVSEEGKSTIACNLATTLAEAGWRVVLVDADLRHPLVADYFGIEATAGLTGILKGVGTLEDVVRQWGSGSLSVLPSGPIPPNPSELLASQEMARMLRQLEERADIVLVDTPPLLPRDRRRDSRAQMCRNLLVTRYGKTRWEQVAQAVERLKTVDVGLLGTVLNFAQPASRMPTATSASLRVNGVPVHERA